MLRKHGVVGKFVEFFGEGLQHLALADRATIGNMAPEYGATCGIFPIDAEAINYLRLSGRDASADRAGRGVREGAGPLARRDDAARRVQLDARARPCRREALARRPEAPAGSRAARGRARELHGRDQRADREPQAAEGNHRALRQRRRRHRGRPRRKRVRTGPARLDARPGFRSFRWRGRDRGDHVVHEHVEPGGHDRRRPARAKGGRERPQGEAVGQDLARAGIEGRHRLSRARGSPRRARQARLLPRRLRLHDLHRQLRSAAGRDLQGDRRRRSRGRLGALGQPQLRRPRASRGEDELPRLAAAGRRVCARRHGRHRSDEGAARHRQRRQAGLPQGHLADEQGNRRPDREVDRAGALREELRRRVQGRQPLDLDRLARRRDLRVGAVDVHQESAVLRRHDDAAGAGRRHPRRALPRPLRRFDHDRPHLAGRQHQEGFAGRAAT